MGDHDAGSPSEQGGEGGLDRRLGAGVDPAGRLVQDQDARVGEHGAGEGEELPLPFAEGAAPLAKLRLVAIRQGRDEAVGAHRPRSGLDLRLGGAVAAVGDVGGDSAGEEERLLEHRRDLPPQALAGHLPHVLAVDPDRAGGDVVEAGDQAGDRGLAGTGPPDEGHRLARLDREGDVLQDGARWVVSKGDAIELDPAPNLADDRGARRVWRLAGLVEDGVDPLAGGEGRLGLGVDLGSELDRPEELLDINQEGGQKADRERVLKDQVAPVADDQGGGEGAQQVHRRGEGGGDAGRLDVGVPVRGVGAAELGDVCFGPIEGLRLAHPDDLLLEIRGHLAGGFPGGPVGGPCATSEEGGDQQHHRDDGEAHQRQPEVQEEHRDHDADQAEEGAEELGQALGDEVVQGIHVVRRAAHQVAERAAVEVAERQVLELVEEARPQRGEDPLPDAADLADLAAGGDGAHAVDEEEEQHRARESGSVARQDFLVDRPADQPRPAGLRRRPEHDQPEGERDLGAEGAQFPQEAPGHRAPVLGPLLGRAGDRFDAHTRSPPASTATASSSRSSSTPSTGVSGTSWEPRISL